MKSIADSSKSPILKSSRRKQALASELEQKTINIDSETHEFHKPLSRTPTYWNLYTHSTIQAVGGLLWRMPEPSKFTGNFRITYKEIRAWISGSYWINLPQRLSLGTIQKCCIQGNCKTTTQRKKAMNECSKFKRLLGLWTKLLRSASWC